jgi:hypothetical protein
LNVVSLISLLKRNAKWAKSLIHSSSKSFLYQAFSPAAHLKNSTVASGCDKNGLWEQNILSTFICAPPSWHAFAIASCTNTGIARSSSQIKYDEGIVLHAALGTPTNFVA